MIYFMHIIKTGGTTFDDILMRQYGVSKIVNLNNEEVDLEFNNLTHSKKIKSELINKPDAIVVTGHFRIGLHNLMNDDKPRYIAFFRNPVEQYLSQYYFSISLEEYPDIKEMTSSRGNIERFIYSDMLLYTENTQTFFLSEAPDRKTFQRDMEYLSPIAIQHVKDLFIFCAITDYFDESLVILRELLQWRKPIYYVKRKVTKNRPKAKTHNQKIIERIKEINKLDLLLYDEALAVFNREKAKIRFFRWKLFKFKVQNFFFAYFHNKNL
ncbi:MAG TPA: sulfotransferase family 2 domain-containing protein [Bacteroidales bacterium]|nr:sulfotransferase family 2 domain-containing protein [Bacteroidales bacterium]